MKILITGDLLINKPYSDSQIDDEIKGLFSESDFNIVNLEAPVTESTSKILKTGPHLKSEKESTLEILKALNINLCTLANNHVLDYDEQGVLDTINFCKENNIQTVGAGKNKEEAAKVLYLETDVGKIAIINIAENEWASATDTTAGANGMDLIDDVKQIQKAKKQSDLVFVIVHGGHEYYNLPSPRMQKQWVTIKKEKLWH
jgi:poly-gamma-glutamate capsule biosynthesis protein CapA/YwtB (metallophosphatase superfamily)